PVASQVGNFFGSVASGPVSFFVLIDFHALPISHVDYTIRSSGGNVGFADTATDPTPPFNYLSSQWDTTQVSNGSYTITASVVEARKKPGVTPRSSEASQTFTVHNTSVSFSKTTYTANESGGSATLTVQLSEPATEFTTVDYETSNGSAAEGQDYTATDGTLDFDINESSKTISVPILDDNRDEPSETFTVKLFSASAASVGSPDTATVTIADDDPAPAITFSSGAYSIGEAGGTATIGVQLNAPSNQQVTVHYATSDGTATAPGDYGAKNGTLTFSPGQTSKTFTVPIVDDTLDEPNETINLALSNPGNATLGSPAGAILTI